MLPAPYKPYDTPYIIDPKVIEIWNDTSEIEFELIHGDAIAFLQSHKFTGKELVYCDPPYLRKTRKNITSLTTQNPPTNLPKTGKY